MMVGDWGVRAEPVSERERALLKGLHLTARDPIFVAPHRRNRPGFSLMPIGSCYLAEGVRGPESRVVAATNGWTTLLTDALEHRDVDAFSELASERSLFAFYCLHQGSRLPLAVTVQEMKPDGIKALDIASVTGYRVSAHLTFNLVNGLENFRPDVKYDLLDRIRAQWSVG